MNKFTKQILLVWAGIGIAALAIVFLTIAAAHAENKPMMPSSGTGSGVGMMGKGMRGRMMAPGVFGKVTAVNGVTITILGGRPTGTQTTFTVDASNAIVIKNATTSSVGNIAVGDVIVAQGTVNGTSVATTRIIDGVMPGRGKLMMGFPGGKFGDASGTHEMGDTTSSRERGERMRPSGTPPFASGTFPGNDHGFRGLPSSTANGTSEPHDNGNASSGFFNSIGDFFGRMFGRLKL
jgi:hypothetical protein